MIRELIRERYEGKSIVLLGFGREGQSTYSLLRQVFPHKPLAIADLSPDIRSNPSVLHDTNLYFHTGEGYLAALGSYEVIFRSPGIPVWHLVEGVENAGGANSDGIMLSREAITSQTELFLECYARQVTGITGTKGKSTTASLLHHILKTAGMDTLLVGNIGNPVFHFIDLIGPETQIVYEMSSHQLEFLKTAPHTAILLNLFQEHLDAYRDYEAYQLAKVNITRYQSEDDFLIYTPDDPLVNRQVEPYLAHRRVLPFSVTERQEPGSFISDGYVCFSESTRPVPVWKVHQDRFLRGEHNLKNIMAAINAAMVCGADPEMISDGIATFKGLEHRLEYVGAYGGIHFYNDSIATIPEACMEAIRAIPDVDTLVAGGFDRGIDYEGLAVFLGASQVKNLILVGAAGKRIKEFLVLTGVKDKQVFFINRFDDFCPIAFRVTRPGHVCLLSPAAASYDEFRNFEERGKRFRDLVRCAVPGNHQPGPN